MTRLRLAPMAVPCVAETPAATQPDAKPPVAFPGADAGGTLLAGQAAAAEA